MAEHDRLTMSDKKQNPQEYESRTPNAETLKAMRQARERVGLTEYASLDELMSEVG